MNVQSRDPGVMDGFSGAVRDGVREGAAGTRGAVRGAGGSWTKKPAFRCVSPHDRCEAENKARSARIIAAAKHIGTTKTHE
jgi:hypothetical protein